MFLTSNCPSSASVVYQHLSLRHLSSMRACPSSATVMHLHLFQISIGPWAAHVLYILYLISTCPLSAPVPRQYMSFIRTLFFISTCLSSASVLLHLLIPQQQPSSINTGHLSPLVPLEHKFVIRTCPSSALDPLQHLFSSAPVNHYHVSIGSLSPAGHFKHRISLFSCLLRSYGK